MSKRILITGASSGIGLATAKQFINQGDDVIGIARHFDSDCAGMQTVSLDLSKLDQLATELDASEVLKQDIDTLVLNAGYGRFGGIEQFSHQQIQHLINTNLTSNLYLIKHYLPTFKAQGGKDIVLTGSESALAGGRQGAIYCASKFAVRGLAQSLRADCSNSDIRVLLVNPGPVNSDFFDELNFQPQSGKEFVIEPETIAESICHALSLPRNTVLDEINIQPMKRSFSKK